MEQIEPGYYKYNGLFYSTSGIVDSVKFAISNDDVDVDGYDTDYLTLADCLFLFSTLPEEYQEDEAYSTLEECVRDTNEKIARKNTLKWQKDGMYGTACRMEKYEKECKKSEKERQENLNTFKVLYAYFHYFRDPKTFTWKEREISTLIDEAVKAMTKKEIDEICRKISKVFHTFHPFTEREYHAYLDKHPEESEWKEARIRYQELDNVRHYFFRRGIMGWLNKPIFCVLGMISPINGLKDRTSGFLTVQGKPYTPILTQKSAAEKERLQELEPALANR